LLWHRSWTASRIERNEGRCLFAVRGNDAVGRLLTTTLTNALDQPVYA
jgi:hypothetical protein